MRNESVDSKKLNDIGFFKEIAPQRGECQTSPDPSASEYKGKNI